jgi:hypothetical protein
MLGGYVRSSLVLAIPSGADASVFASCDDGDVATGGGFSTGGEPGSLRVYEARPYYPQAEEGGDDSESLSMPGSYRVWAVNDTTGEGELQAWVMCIDLTP